MPNREMPFGSPDGRLPPSNPGTARLKRYLTYGLFAWVALLIAFFLAQGNPGPPEPGPEPAALEPEPPRGFDPVRDVHDSVAAAKRVHQLLTEKAPGADKIIAFVDVSTKDGHLMVHFTELYNLLEPSDKASFEDPVVTLWGQTKYVANRGWDPSVEFVEHEGKATRSRVREPKAPADPPVPATAKPG